jgi:apolipoprotein N-acyltransferase
MLMRTFVTLAAILALGSSNGWADDHKAPRHHRHAHIVRYQEQPLSPAPYTGGTLVLHPASNIACDTPFRAPVR